MSDHDLCVCGHERRLHGLEADGTYGLCARDEWCQCPGFWRHHYVDIQQEIEVSENYAAKEQVCQQANTVGLTPDRTVEGLSKVLSMDQCEDLPKVMIALPANAAETLRCLFFHGPTWDGNVPSKSGRDELVDMKLAQRGNGWQWLTKAGIEACFAAGIHNEKDRRESRERKNRHLLADAMRQFLG